MWNKYKYTLLATNIIHHRNIYIILYFVVFVKITAYELEWHCFSIDYFAKDRYTPDPHDSTMAIPCKSLSLSLPACLPIYYISIISLFCLHPPLIFLFNEVIIKVSRPEMNWTCTTHSLIYYYCYFTIHSLCRVSFLYLLFTTFPLTIQIIPSHIQAFSFICNYY